MEQYITFDSASPARNASSRPGNQATSSQHSLSTLAGYVRSVRDRSTPVVDACLTLDVLDVCSRRDGQYDVSLDALPVQVEVRILARGYHPYYERVDWASVATGGLLVRDFYLTPIDMPAPLAGRSADMPVSLEMPGVRDELELEDGIELELEEEYEIEALEADDEFCEEEETEWENGEGGEDPFEAVSMAWDGKDDLDAEIELSIDPVPGPPRVVRWFGG